MLPGTSLTVQYTYRNMGRVLEDLGSVPIVAFDLGVQGIAEVKTIVTNPSRAATRDTRPRRSSVPRSTIPSTNITLSS